MGNFLRARTALLGVALACALPLAANASGTNTLPIQSLNDVPPESTRGWDITVGAGAGYSPVYPGSRRYEPKPLFFGSISYKRLAFIGPAGLGASLVDSGGFRAGPVFGYGGGRREGADPRLAGMGNLDSSINAGAFIAYRFDDFELHATARQALTHSNNGMVGRVQLEYIGAFPEYNIDFRIGPEFDFGDARHVRTWYGVSALQAARAALPAYHPSGGLIDYGAHAIINYHWSPSLFLRFTADVRQYTSDVEHSPIVETKTQAYIGLGLGYKFQLDENPLNELL